jgi:WD40 repeat protein
VDVQATPKVKVVEKALLSGEHLHSSIFCPNRKCAAFGLDGSLLLIREISGGEVKVYDLASGQWRPSFAGTGQADDLWTRWLEPLDFQPQPSVETRPRWCSLAANREGTVLVTFGDGRLFLWDVAGGKELRRIASRCPLGPFVAIASANEMVVASCDFPDGPAIRLWNMNDGSLRGEFGTLPAKRTNDLAFSADGHCVAVARSDGVRIYDLGSPQPREFLAGESAYAVAFSPDGGKLAVAQGNQVALIDVGSGRKVTAHQDSDSVTSVAYSSAGDLVAFPVSGGRVALWNPTMQGGIQTVAVTGRSGIPWTLPAALLVVWVTTGLVLRAASPKALPPVRT